MWSNTFLMKKKLVIVTNEKFFNSDGKFSCDNIAEKSGENPLQTFVDAICNGAPMEEITRIKFGAVSQPKAVDSSPSRRLDVALRNLAKGAQQGTHKSKRTLTSCIINELTKAASGDVTSFAVSKKEELERIAASAR